MSKKEREANRAARAAAVRKAQQDRERNRRIALTVGILVALVAVIVGGVLLSGRGDSGGGGTDAPVAVDGSSLVVGDASDAPRVVVYEDFLCPYCREFESESRDYLRQAAADGSAVIEYRPFHLLQDDYSTRALTAWAAVAQLGTPQQALRFHDLLYENQPYEADPDKPTTDDLVALARKAGVSDEQVLAAIGKEDQSFVDRADAAAQKVGVDGTPTVFLDGKQLPAASPSDLFAAVKQKIGQ